MWVYTLLVWGAFSPLPVEWGQYQTRERCEERAAYYAVAFPRISGRYECRLELKLQ